MMERFCALHPYKIFYVFAAGLHPQPISWMSEKHITKQPKKPGWELEWSGREALTPNLS